MKQYRHIRKFGVMGVVTLAILLTRCKDPYISPYGSPPLGYLVVEGYISANTVTRFTLSRTIPLPGDSTLPLVNGAAVQVEGSDNSVHPLKGLDSGVYSSIDTLQLNPQMQYRLRIKTGDGDEFLSDFVQCKITPAIDSINFVQKSDLSIEIYANAHDVTNNTRYYQWDFTQTFEHRAAEESGVMWDKDTIPPMVVGRPPQDEIFRCWSTSNSTSILIDNTTKLAQDVVYEQPLKYIPPNDIQSSVMYSIIVRQYALTADGYNFLSAMQKNTESLGSIFDAQPTQLASNIHSLVKPGEHVIGWISAGTVQQQRIFIQRYQLVSSYVFECPLKDTVFPLNQKILEANLGTGFFIPIFFTQGPMGTGWESNEAGCIDCRSQGGTTTKPSFWPN